MTVEFARDIGPLLEAKCLRCHNSNTSKGDISMATLSEIQTAGEDLLIPGNPDESKLHWITLPIDNGEPPEMPEEGEPLTKQEAEMLATWIREGANWPAEIVLKEPSKADKTWWSFQPLAEAKHQSIDAHIEARLNETGLVMNPEADKRTLPALRRIKNLWTDCWRLRITANAGPSIGWTLSAGLRRWASKRMPRGKTRGPIATG